MNKNSSTSSVRKRIVETARTLIWILKLAPKPTKTGSVNADKADNATKSKNALYCFNFARATATAFIFVSLFISRILLRSCNNSPTATVQQGSEQSGNLFSLRLGVKKNRDCQGPAAGLLAASASDNLSEWHACTVRIYQGPSTLKCTRRGNTGKVGQTRTG